MIVSRRVMMITRVYMLSNVSIVANPISPLLKTINFIYKKKYLGNTSGKKYFIPRGTKIRLFS
jgi:hypothetical protein